MRSRYRLGFLSRKGALEAVRGPALALGGDFEEEAAQLLLDQLPTTTAHRDGLLFRVPSPFVEPVILQTVCLNLWDRVASEGRTVIGLNDVRRFLGGHVDEALGGYFASAVRSVSERT